MEIKLNDTVRYVGIGTPETTGIPADAIGSVIRIYDDLRTDYGDPVTHLVRFDFDGDLERELCWFAPDDLEVVNP